MKIVNLALLLLAGVLVCGQADAPPRGLTTHGTVLEVYDGDTIVVEVREKIRIRMRDCWAPEVTGAEKSRGLVSRDELRKILPDGSEVRIHIPSDGNLGSSFTFGRVLADVWSTEDLTETVASKMVRSGFATREKAKSR